MNSCRRTLITLTLLVTAACSPERTTWDASQRAVAAMGGAARVGAIGTLVLSGGQGTRDRLGQIHEEGARDPQATLTGVRTTIDLANLRAAFEYDVSLASGFMQHRTEVLTEVGGRPVGYSINDNGRMASTPGGLFSWGPQNSPVIQLRRDPVRILLDAATSGSGAGALEEVEFNGSIRLHGRFSASWGEEIGLFFDPDSELLVGFETLDTETMLGDVDAQYTLGDYQEADGILLPHRVRVIKDGAPFSDVRYQTIAVNSPGADSIFDLPGDLAPDAAAAAEADERVPLTLTPVAEGVYHVAAYSHHSMVVEFPTFVAVVEAPYTETQSLTLAGVIEEAFPGKPIRYVAPTHAHWDHTGGIRGMASTGATVLVASGHENQIRQIVNAPHTNPPDRLEETRRAGAAGSVEAYDGIWTTSEGNQSLELYEVSGSPHVEPVVLAWVPASGVLFQSDLFSPGTGGGGTPASAHLERAVRDLGLDVTILVGGHGGVGPFSELVRANSGN